MHVGSDVQNSTETLDTERDAKVLVQIVQSIEYQLYIQWVGGGQTKHGPIILQSVTSEYIERDKHLLHFD